MLVGSHTARRPDWPAVHVHTSAGAARVEHNRELSAIVSWRRTLAASTAVVVPPVEKARQQHNPDQHHEQAADEIFALPWNQIRRRCRRTCTTSRPTGTVVSQRSGSVCGFNVLQHSKPRSVLLHRNAPPHDGRNVQLCTTTKFTPVLPACQCDTYVDAIPLRAFEAPRRAECASGAACRLSGASPSRTTLDSSTASCVAGGGALRLAQACSRSRDHRQRGWRAGRHRQRARTVEGGLGGVVGVFDATQAQISRTARKRGWRRVVGGA